MINDVKKIVILAEQKKGKIHKVTYELLGKAAELIASFPEGQFEKDVIVLGSDQLNLDEILHHGADKIYHIAANSFDMPDEWLYKENICELLKQIQPEMLLVGATTFGRSLAPRIAAALETGLTADCTELMIDTDGKLIQIRPAFSDNILAHIKTETLPQMATIRYKEFAPAEWTDEVNGEIIKVDAYVKGNELIEILEELEESEFDISDAHIVISAGKGIKSKEDMKMIYELAECLKADVGASRAIVDEGYIDKSHQVGYSGNRVKPSLYIACGVSGAPQHLAGMKESDVIVAINSDASAPIFEVSDYGIVGDVYKVVPMLIERLRSKEI
ncbi:electron transfer flavoprotein subunit alpha/FixB family protein [Anaerovorax sp. IOR16]|uniref:electron transfer flavoprotein subunit alpha/FixB family protein n=1 Tax=Anaerovorax sp. IOR16 TaxID=2773458 RepID=UPI0019D0DD7D|nr:electron transfer flavoprotein subunit alpha/FixB family protein [Anaerovorax sp. IOR16]